MTLRLTVAEVFRKHRSDFLNAFGARLLYYQLKAFNTISVCRTAVLGGRVMECTSCGKRHYHYNSCRTRGCPLCEGSKEAKWMLAREAELLPTKYFHVVFTLPHVFNDLFLHNQKECFAIFFRAVSKTLLTVGKNRFDGKLGFFCILHTWGQKLDLHHHIHCVAPGGALKNDGAWIPTSKKKLYFLPEPVLVKVFQGIFLRSLRSALKRGKIVSTQDLEVVIREAMKKQWVVHTEPPFSSALCVLKYLSRYTRKVAISNSRLIALADGLISFSWKDYANYAVQKICKISVLEFIRRFLMHIPPPGFVRIRHYGFMAGKDRKARLLALKETILGLLPHVIHPKSDGSFVPGKCPFCKNESLIQVATLLPILIPDSS